MGRMNRRGKSRASTGVAERSDLLPSPHVHPAHPVQKAFPFSCFRPFRPFAFSFPLRVLRVSFVPSWFRPSSLADPERVDKTMRVPRCFGDAGGAGAAADEGEGALQVAAVADGDVDGGDAGAG